MDLYKPFQNHGGYVRNWLAVMFRKCFLVIGTALDLDDSFLSDMLLP